MVMLPSVYTAKAYGLFVDGLDVLKEPATPARYGVPVESISVTEAGPGGVSSMRFTIDDPQNLITIADGATIIFYDLAHNRPIFLGFVEAVAKGPDFGQQGRSQAVSAFGIEALLDLVIIPSLTLTWQGTSASDGSGWYASRVLQLLAGFGPLRQFMSSFKSALETPVGSSAGFAPIAFLASVVFDGKSIRQAFEAYNAIAIPGYPGWFLTVDPWGGVRLFPVGGFAGTTFLPTDYSTMTIDNSPTGTLACSELTYTIDTSPGAIVNAVYVKGAAAASTGWVVGDTSLGRREQYATTAGSSEDDKQAAAQAVMGTRQYAAGRGSFVLEAYTPTNCHPGSSVIITDTRLGWTAKELTISGITKTFNSNLSENWTVSFTDPLASPVVGQASAMRLARKYTRNVN